MGKFFEGNSHYYEYISKATDFWTASSDSLGSFKYGTHGYLVEINDHAENEFVSNLVGNNHSWIGLSDVVKEGDYRWVTSYITTNYTNWNNGEPNNTLHFINLFILDYDFVSSLRSWHISIWACRH